MPGASVVRITESALPTARGKAPERAAALAISAALPVVFQPVLVARSTPLARSSRRGAASAVVTPRPRRAGPTARRRTGFDSRPVMTKPTMATWSPLPAVVRVERFTIRCWARAAELSAKPVNVVVVPAAVVTVAVMPPVSGARTTTRTCAVGVVMDRRPRESTVPVPASTPKVRSGRTMARRLRPRPSTKEAGAPATGSSLDSTTTTACPSGLTIANS